MSVLPTGSATPQVFQLLAAAAPLGTGLLLCAIQCAAKAPHHGVVTEVGFRSKIRRVEVVEDNVLFRGIRLADILLLFFQATSNQGASPCFACIISSGAFFLIRSKAFASASFRSASAAAMKSATDFGASIGPVYLLRALKKAVICASVRVGVRMSLSGLVLSASLLFASRMTTAAAGLPLM